MSKQSSILRLVVCILYWFVKNQSKVKITAVLYCGVHHGEYLYALLEYFSKTRYLSQPTISVTLAVPEWLVLLLKYTPYVYVAIWFALIPQWVFAGGLSHQFISITSRWETSTCLN